MKDVNELREILCDTIDGLVADKTAIRKAQAVVNAVGKFLDSIRLQMEYAKLKGETVNIRVKALESAKV